MSKTVIRKSFRLYNEENPDKTICAFFSDNTGTYIIEERYVQGDSQEDDIIHQVSLTKEELSLLIDMLIELTESADEN